MSVNPQIWIRARQEHALILRCEGMLLKDIGERFGIGINGASRLVALGARRLRWGMQHCKFTWNVIGDD